MLLAGPVFHTNIQYMDFVKFSMFHWTCVLFISLISGDVELSLCIVVQFYLRMG